MRLHGEFGLNTHFAPSGTGLLPPPKKALGSSVRLRAGVAAICPAFTDAARKPFVEICSADTSEKRQRSAPTMSRVAIVSEIVDS